MSLTLANLGSVIMERVQTITKKFDISNCRILLINDDDTAQMYLNNHLSSAVFTSITSVENVQSRLDAIDYKVPDLIILDHQLPVIDGFHYLDIIRQHQDHKYIPIIVTTGEDNSITREALITAGASLLINKPIKNDNLKIQIRLILERELLMRSLKDNQGKMSSGLNTAVKMQQSLLPSYTTIQSIENRYEVNLSSYYRPCSEIGGDYWGLHAIDDNCFGLFLLDFSGHGVVAAINTFRLHSIICDISIPTKSPSAYLSLLNNYMYSALPAGQFATMIYMLIDLKTSILTYATACASPPLFISPRLGENKHGSGVGLPLGAMKNAKYEDRVQDFSDGSSLFIYSDSFIESPGHDGHMHSQETIIKWAEIADEKNPDDPLFSVLEQFFETTPTPLPDDLTCVWLKRP